MLKFDEARHVDATADRKVGPSGRPGTKLGDVLKEKLADKLASAAAAKDE